MRGRPPALEIWSSREFTPENVGARNIHPEIATQRERLTRLQEGYQPPLQISSPRTPNYNSKQSPVPYDYRQASPSPGQTKWSSEASTDMMRPKLSIIPSGNRPFTEYNTKLRETDFDSSYETEVSSICHSPGWDDLSGKKSKEKRAMRAKKRRDREKRENEGNEKLKAATFERPILQSVKEREREQRAIKERMKSDDSKKSAVRPKKLSKLPPKEKKELANITNIRSNSDPFIIYHRSQGKETESSLKFHYQNRDIDAKTSPIPLSSSNTNPSLKASANQEKTFIGGLKLRQVEDANVQDAINKIRARSERENRFDSSQVSDERDRRNNDLPTTHNPGLSYTQGKSATSPGHSDQLFAKATRKEGKLSKAPIHAEKLLTKLGSRRTYPPTVHYFKDDQGKKIQPARYAKGRNLNRTRTADMRIQSSPFDDSAHKQTLPHQLRSRSVDIHDFVKDELDLPTGNGMAQRYQESSDEIGSTINSDDHHATVKYMKAVRSSTKYFDPLGPNNKPDFAGFDNEAQRTASVKALNIHIEGPSNALHASCETVYTPSVEDFVEQLPFSGCVDSIHENDSKLFTSHSSLTTASSEEDSACEESSNITTPIMSRPHSTKDKSPGRVFTNTHRTPPQSNSSAEDDNPSSLYSVEQYEEKRNHPHTPTSVKKKKLSTPVRLAEGGSPSPSRERHQKIPRQNLTPDSYFLPNHSHQAVAWSSNDNDRSSRGLIRKPRIQESDRSRARQLNTLDLNSESPEFSQKARKNPILPEISPRSPRSPRLPSNKYLAQKPIDPFAKMFVVCCSCKFFHDLPSKLYACMSGPANVVTEENLGVSGVMITSVECPWCGHGMTTSCCAGYAAILYMKERLH